MGWRGDDIGLLERDASDVASDLTREAGRYARRTGDYKLATLMIEAAAWIEELSDE